MEKDKVNTKHVLGTFYNIVHYMKLYDTLKGAYSNYKVCLCVCVCVCLCVCLCVCVCANNAK